jgi:HSP20 family molecular chaperone IbpA
MPSWLSTLMLFSPQASVAMSVAMTQQQQEPLTEQAQSPSPKTSVEVAAHVAGVPLNTALSTVLSTALSTASHSMRGQEFPCAQHGAGGASVREVPCALDLAMAANALVDARLHAMPQAEWLGAIGGILPKCRRLPYLVSPPPPAPPAIAAALGGTSLLSNGGSGSNSPQHRLTPKGLLDRLTSSSQGTPRGAQHSAQHSTATSPSSRTSAAAGASVAAPLSPPTERFDANPDLVAMRSKRAPVSTERCPERERADGTGTSLAGSPPGAHHGASSVAARPGAAGIDDLLFYLRRNEQLLQQQREQLLERNAELRAELGARGVVAPLHVASYQQLEVGVQSSVHTAASQLEAYDAILDVAAMEHALGKGWTLRLSPLACTRGKLIRGEQSPRRKSSHGTSNLATTATANFALDGPLAGGAGARSGRRSREVAQEKGGREAGSREVAQEKGGREAGSREVAQDKGGREAGSREVAQEKGGREAGSREVAQEKGGREAAEEGTEAAAEADAGWALLDEPGLVRVAVLGSYNSGKTFLLNRLSGLELPSSRRVATRGLGLRRAVLGGEMGGEMGGELSAELSGDLCGKAGSKTSGKAAGKAAGQLAGRPAAAGGGLPAMLLDTEGFFAPVHIDRHNAMQERQETEELIELLALRLADYVLYVVEDFTSVVQRQAHRLARRVTQRTRGFTELIVVHNLRTVTTETALRQIWRTQVTSSVTDGEAMIGVVPNFRTSGRGGGSRAVAGARAEAPEPTTRPVDWFKSASGVRHVALVQQLCPFGEAHNKATCTLLQQWLESAYVPVATLRPPLLTQLALDCEAALIEKAKRTLHLEMESTSEPTVRRLRAVVAPDEHDAPRQRANAARRALLSTHGADAATAGPGKPLAEPSKLLSSWVLPSMDPQDDMATIRLCSEGGWLPHVDLCEGTEAFVLLVDMPGMRASDLKLSRSGSLTRVSGSRAPPYSDAAEELRGERPYGTFSLSVRVPDRYHKRWREAHLIDGVLRLSYAADADDDDG